MPEKMRRNEKLEARVWICQAGDSDPAYSVKRQCRGQSKFSF